MPRLTQRESEQENGRQKGLRDPTAKARERTKAGRALTRSVGLPFFQIGFVPWETINGSLLKAAWVEFVATLAFLYLSTGSIVFGCSVTDVGADNTGSSGGQTAVPTDCFLSTTRVLAIATSFGVTIFVMVYASSPFSGGHINPAVSLAFFLTKKLSFVRLLLYWCAQFGGAIVGSFFVRATYKTGFGAADGGANRLLSGFDQSGCWLLETILTFILVLVVFLATDQKRGQSTAHVPILAPLGSLAAFDCRLCCHWWGRRGCMSLHPLL